MLLEVVVQDPDGSRRVLMSKSAYFVTAALCALAAASTTFIVLSFAVGVLLGVLINQGVVSETAYTETVLPVGLLVTAVALCAAIWAWRKFHDIIRGAASKAEKSRGELS